MGQLLSTHGTVATASTAALPFIHGRGPFPSGEARRVRESSAGFSAKAQRPHSSGPSFSFVTSASSCQKPGIDQRQLVSFLTEYELMWGRIYLRNNDDVVMNVNCLLSRHHTLC